MYVTPTPYVLTKNTEGQITLILPSDIQVDGRLVARGKLVRIEADQLLVGYEFDLRTNALSAQYVPNPDAGRKHHFIAYRVATEPGPQVFMAD